MYGKVGMEMATTATPSRTTTTMVAFPLKFFVIAFAFTWLFWGPQLLAVRGVPCAPRAHGDQHPPPSGGTRESHRPGGRTSATSQTQRANKGSIRRNNMLDSLLKASPLRARERGLFNQVFGARL